MLMIIAVCRLNSNIGIRNVRAIINFVMKVVVVAFQMCFLVFFLFDSSLRWIPSASLNASATAIVMIPLMTISLLLVAEDSPMKSPSVVMIAEVSPNDIPTLVASFIIN